MKLRAPGGKGVRGVGERGNKAGNGENGRPPSAFALQLELHDKG